MRFFRLLSIYLALTSGLLALGSGEYDTASVIRELKQSHAHRMLLAKRASDNFAAAHSNLKEAERLDNQATLTTTIGETFQRSYLETIANKKRMLDEENGREAQKANRLSDAIRKKSDALDHLVSTYNALRTSAFELIAEAEANPGRPQSYYDLVNKSVGESFAKMGELKTAIDLGDQSVSTMEAELAAFVNDLQRRNENYLQWVSRYEHESKTTYDRYVDEKKKSVGGVKTSVSQFLAQYKEGFGQLEAYRITSQNMRGLAQKFLAGLEGLTDFLCFEEGTLVDTPNGPKAIETFQEGDEVIACNEKTQACSVQRVAELIETQSNFLVELIVEGESLLATPNHPIFTRKNGWQKAIDIKQFDEVLSLYLDKDGSFILKPVVIAKKPLLKKLEKPVKVFNLAIDSDDSRTYFVGPSHILAHNCSFQKQFDIIKPLEGLSSSSGTVVNLNTPNVSIGLGAVVLVGGAAAAAGTTNLAVIMACCLVAGKIAIDLVAYDVEFGGNLTILQNRGFGIEGPSESEIWKSLEPFRGKIKTQGKGRKKRFFEWDRTHKDIEVYDRNGKHIGSMNPQSGEIYKPAVPGREIQT